MTDGPRWYLVVCRECPGDLPMPFTSQADRGKWATAHTGGTGHKTWAVWDEPRPVEES